MTRPTAQLELLLRLRLLEVDGSRRAAQRCGKERAAAAAERETAADRHSAALRLEAEALAARNAHPGDPAFLFHSRASAARSSQAEAALIESRSRETAAEEAARQARRDLLKAETRHDAVAERIKAEQSRARRRADRRREDDGGGRAPLAELLTR